MAPTQILGDWGGTHLRLFRIQDGKSTGQCDGPGTTRLIASAADTLTALLAGWINEGPIEGITMCGMAGSPSGLLVAPYAPCPATFEAWAKGGALTEVAGIPVRILQGLSHWHKGVPDVMRGEETQIFGALALHDALRQGQHTLVLPGTHSKWVRLEDGAISSFRTAPTGEVYALLAEQSSLPGIEGAGEGSFDEGFGCALERSGSPLLGVLFEARAARMLDGKSHGWAKGFLSGLLIGNELAEFASGIDEVTIIAAAGLATLYETVLTQWGTQVRLIDGEDAVLQGLIRAAKAVS